jgi:hypothetical protein
MAKKKAAMKAQANKSRAAEAAYVKVREGKAASEGGGAGKSEKRAKEGVLLRRGAGRGARGRGAGGGVGGGASAKRA